MKGGGRLLALFFGFQWRPSDLILSNVAVLLTELQIIPARKCTTVPITAVLAYRGFQCYKLYNSIDFQFSSIFTSKEAALYLVEV
jgi:hypothetical protein